MNSTGNCTIEDPEFQLGLTVYTGTLLVLGIVFNVVALWVFCCRMRRKQWTETVIYMSNLAVADLCLLCALPIMIYSQRQIKQEDTVLCQVSQSIYLINRYMSISIITAISVDRYVAIQFPMQAKRLRSPGLSAIICALLWVLVIASTVTRMAWQIQYGGFCFLNENAKGSKTTLFSLLGFFIPLVILTFCSVQVIVKLVRKTKTDAREKRAIHKAIWIISANLLVFVACFLPLHVTLSIRLIMEPKTCSSLKIWRYAITITSRLSSANCCLDAICYYFVAKEFQDASAQAIFTLSRSSRLQDSTRASLSQ
ncbi:G-protein coupled receptor 35-like [Gracilinanus agilis]|uniref:G-protein coupled receptor 35-like n=1 Tax=Gracilinanus agilis TaxID=191870 RepID=UPI001CFE54CE|nr:G-protein coupled receptor 35-like [Gracilinanus agilis]